MAKRIKSRDLNPIVRVCVERIMKTYREILAVNRLLLLLALYGAAAFRPVAAQSELIRVGSDSILVHPIRHATFVLQSQGKTLFIDPVGPKEVFEYFGNPDRVLITDVHSDHLDVDLVASLTAKQTTIVAPQSVFEHLPLAERAQTKVLHYGDALESDDIGIEAVPMYNLSPDRTFHGKGRGNGYVVTLAGERIYISGDTEDIPEMRALEDIDIAFVCMNLPYTMDVEAAADAVLAFKPRIVYPYHYQGQDGLADVGRFKDIVSADPSIEVHQLDWYREDR